MNDNTVGRCIRCNATFTYLQHTNNSSRCTKCNSKSIPLLAEYDVGIAINVQELRVILMWAENHARSVDEENLDNVDHESCVSALKAISGRIREQLKVLNKDASLLFSYELKDLRSKYGQVDHYIGGKIQEDVDDA